MRNFTLIGVLFLCSMAQAKATLELHSFRNPIVILENQKAKPLGRGQQLLPNSEITMGRNSVATWDTRSGSLSALGPALFLFSEAENGSQILKLEYGTLYLLSGRAEESETLKLEFEDWSLETQDQIFLKISRGPGSLKYELTNLGLGEIALFNGKKILPAHSAILSGEDFQQFKKDDSEIQAERNKFSSLRNFTENTNSSETAPSLGSELLDKYAEGGVFFGFSRLRPDESSTFVQDLGGMGAYFKKGNNSYFRMPTDPTKIPRNFGLYAASIRYGWGIYFSSFWVEPILGLSFKSQALVPHLFLGWGWDGLNLDLFAGPALDLNQLLRNEFKMRWPVGMGFDANYRIDLAKLMDSEMGLIVGLRYMTTFYTRNSEVISSEASQVSPQSFYSHTFSFQTGLNFRF